MIHGKGGIMVNGQWLMVNGQWLIDWLPITLPKRSQLNHQRSFLSSRAEPRDLAESALQARQGEIYFVSRFARVSAPLRCARNDMSDDLGGCDTVSAK